MVVTPAGTCINRLFRVCCPSAPKLPHLWAPFLCSEWSVDDRCTLLRLLCSLSAESAALHDTLHGDEEEVRPSSSVVGLHLQLGS